MVLSAEAFQRQQHGGESLVAFIRRSPLVEAEELDLKRHPDLTRELDVSAMVARKHTDAADLPVTDANPWQDDGTV